MKKSLSVLVVAFLIMSCNETEKKTSENTTVPGTENTVASNIDSAAIKAKMALDTAAVAAQKAISDAAEKARALKDGAVKRVHGIKISTNKLKKITNK